MPHTFEVSAIGRVTTGRTEAVDDEWDGVRSTIVLDPHALSLEATLGLGEFSHVEVVFLFDQVDPADIETGARHPRGNRAWPRVGILAQRPKMRPNRIGVSVCELVDVDGLTLQVRGLDAIEGTPVLDVKPVMAEFLPRAAVRQPSWSHELMEHYW
jgi:tRNA (adenine37-N6)-methyltransferase